MLIFHGVNLIFFFYLKFKMKNCNWLWTFVPVRACSISTFCPLLQTSLVMDSTAFVELSSDPVKLLQVEFW